MDGGAVRERRPKEPKVRDNDLQPQSEKRKSEKTCGRTPDGTGKSDISGFTTHRRVKFVLGFVTGKTSQGKG